MHEEAYAGFARMLEQTGLDVNGSWQGLDVGGADVNGSVRGQLPNTQWIGLDIEDAPGVQIIADAATWPAKAWDFAFDIVIATELFEHAEQWEAIIGTMADALKAGGPEILIATCASDGRPPHGSRGEWGVPAGQFYGNVSPGDLERVLKQHFELVHVEYNPNPGDAYMWAQGVKR
jgi:hypothetical protein